MVQAKPGETIDLDELRAFVDERVGGYKRPRTYERRDRAAANRRRQAAKRVLRDEFWGDRDRAV